MPAALNSHAAAIARHAIRLSDVIGRLNYGSPSNTVTGLDAYTDHERWLDLGVFHSTDLLEGVTAFAEKRPPRFTGG